MKHLGHRAASLLVVIAWLEGSAALAQDGVRVIWVPISPGGRTINYATTKADGPLTITTQDGESQVVRNVEFKGIEMSLLRQMAFSYEEGSLLALFKSWQSMKGGTFVEVSRNDLRTQRKPYYWVFVPITSIARITAQRPWSGDSFFEIHLAPETSGASLPPLASDHNCACRITGEVHMGEFGTAEFDSTLGYYRGIREIIFPPSSGELRIAPKSSLGALVTEVGGRKHQLSDVRIEDGTLWFWKGGSKLTLDPSRVKRIDVMDLVDEKYEFQGAHCSVYLKDGAMERLVWKEPDLGDENYNPGEYGVGGRTPGGWYELIPLKAIESVEFTDS